ncbi:CAP domain-containing protein (plasmid) [Skermanella mucosa]|uniref:CAP domain-containing protein n=1 Tax=Skermanella mucosa TaxID=1789672 RepID=UPI00192AD14B|nr:CAP domain-containing protein [Skermanella mucosa]UEM24569.1 CAP domain-containing protein [Skermanella mucosa]
MDMAIPTELETYFLQLVNADRAKAGVAALVFDGELIDSARTHSQWMDATDSFSHTGAGGSSPGNRMAAAGYDARGWGENIAYIGGSRAEVLDKADVDQLHTNLMNSPGHRANLLNANYREIGIGLDQGDINGYKAVFVTQNFGTPSASEAAEQDKYGSSTQPQPAPSPVPQPIPQPAPQPADGTVIAGTNRSDRLFGARGNDAIDGKGGNDSIWGGIGNDILTGGAGRDDFIFTGRSWGHDTVKDFSPGDDLVFSRSAVGSVRNILAHAENVDGDTVFDFGALGSVTLLGVEERDLSSSDFVLV